MWSSKDSISKDSPGSSCNRSRIGLGRTTRPAGLILSLGFIMVLYHAIYHLICQFRKGRITCSHPAPSDESERQSMFAPAFVTRTNAKRERAAARPQIALCLVACRTGYERSVNIELLLMQRRVRLGDNRLLYQLFHFVQQPRVVCLQRLCYLGIDSQHDVTVLEL